MHLLADDKARPSGGKVKRTPQCSADSTNNIVRITWLAEIRVESGSHRSCFIFRRWVACQCDYGTDSPVFRVAFSDRFEQLIPIGITEAYVSHYGMSRTSAKRLNSIRNRLRHDNRRTILFQYRA